MWICTILLACFSKFPSYKLIRICQLVKYILNKLNLFVTNVLVALTFVTIIFNINQLFLNVSVHFLVISTKRQRKLLFTSDFRWTISSNIVCQSSVFSTKGSRVFRGWNQWGRDGGNIIPLLSISTLFKTNSGISAGGCRLSCWFWSIFPVNNRQITGARSARGLRRAPIKALPFLTGLS